MVVIGVGVTLKSDVERERVPKLKRLVDRKKIGIGPRLSFAEGESRVVRGMESMESMESMAFKEKGVRLLFL